MTKVWPVLALGALASMPRSAMAEAAAIPLELTWNAPAACPEATFVRRRIEQVIRGPEAAEARAEATVESGSDGRFRVTLLVRTSDVEERRTIEASSCSTLAEAVAVVVAYVIDPSSGADRDSIGEPARPPPPSGVAATGEIPAAPARGRRPEKTKPLPARPPVAQAMQLALGLGSSVSLGRLPEASTGIVATAALRLQRFRVGALGTVSFRQNPVFDGQAGASFDMVEVGAFGGYMVPLGVVALGPCANVEATYLRLRGFGIQEPWTSSGAWLTFVLGARVEMRALRWLALFARTDLLFPAFAPTFVLATKNGGVALHDVAALAPRFSLGVEFLLP